MSGVGRGVPDTGMVIAAQRGNPHALDDLVADSLPLVYNIVGRALRGHVDVDDVVQETLVRVVRHLSDLRDPEAFRPWLVAITIRQIRNWEQHRRTALIRDAGVEAIHEVPDPAADFAEVTILRLGLTDQRREVAEATRWLDSDDQELLSLWWLEETGELDRADLAAALGLSASHAAVRIHRMKEQIQTARTVVRALRGRPGCNDLRVMTAGWNGTPTPLWRKRLARHVRDCPVCGRYREDFLPIDRLLAGLPLLPLPASFGDQAAAAAAAHAGAATPHVAATTPQVDAASGGTSWTPDPSAVDHSGWLGHLFAGGAGKVMVAAATVATLVAGALVVTKVTGSPPSSAAPPAAEASVARPSPTPSALTPTPSASPKATPTARPSSKAPAAGPAVSSAKKGVAVWDFNGASQALANSKASWYYTWNTGHPGITTPSGVQFVPMIRDSKSVTAAELARAKAAGPYLLAFNEPDLAEQANMTPEAALDLWPQLVATGATLGSPSVAWGAADAGGWLDRFMSGAKSRGLRVDFIALHWYGGDFNTTNAVNQLKQYLTAVYNRYKVPIWLTEFALMNFVNGGQRFPTQEQQAAFVTASAKMLAGLSFVHRYAWFGLPATDKDQSGLFRTGTEATAVGRAFQAAG
ncbi:sigma-70 family RNA polymerase sigma factor [Micromonospora sp. NBC_01796]|uniref:sigma-70 family RNA polymerase sigma factor n=1 Tax=Micromonospora sp. NBC_01796 TaxID=2975987 RepID=UPI002DDA5F2C|nr:sigma-70 family RNA polymerase sigma factor [Micromonospora sp. NBC_01796]WSA82765.1 sigma-70 family RNA polymerase sigma factor [Micromonospora sp. NBC_01796]